MSAWVKQFKFQVDKLGADKASWYAVWHDPNGVQRRKSHGPGPDGKRNAKAHAKQLKAQLALGQYDARKPDRTRWKEFVDRYLEDLASRKRQTSQTTAMYSLRAFTRVLNLDNKPVSTVSTDVVDEFVRKRLKERGVKPGSLVSPATVNKDLRHVQAALKKAVRWKYLANMPEIDFIDEPKHLKNFVTESDFVAIYQSCDVATSPADEELSYAPADWWRGLLTFAFCTGWRIGEMLSLEWEDVHLDESYAVTRAAKNKGKRDESIHLAPLVVEHLRRLVTIHEPLVFPWHNGDRDLSRRRLYDQFGAIQKAAGIHLPCIEQRTHECTESCHRYSFHDERRAFATLNADRLTKDELRRLMRHQSGSTTERYIQYGQATKPKPVDVHVPNLSCVNGVSTGDSEVRKI